MKEPVLIKDAIYPPGVLLKAGVHSFTDWTELCEGRVTGAFEIVGEPDTNTEFVIYQNLPSDAKAASQIRVRADRNAKVQIVLVQEGASVSHFEIKGQCAGSGSEIAVRGLQNTKGTQKHSFNVEIHHEGAHSKSDLKVWCVGRDQGHSIFNASVTIGHGTKNAEAYQRNKNLMLSNRATMDTFPKLFIANDEVKAAHGASVSTIDLEQLNYLQSRGIARDTAEEMVVRGFVHQVVEDLKDASLRQKVESKLGLGEFLTDAEGWES